VCVFENAYTSEVLSVCVFENAYTWEVLSACVFENAYTSEERKVDCIECVRVLYGFLIHGRFPQGAGSIGIQCVRMPIDV
jgi:hypothetical protein